MIKCIPLNDYNVAKLSIEKAVINDSPEYQRESGVWSVAKQQLFIDTILNRFDVPKLYFHDVSKDKTPFKFAVIDGKQRVHAIWNFLAGQFPLGASVEVPEEDRTITKQQAAEGATCTTLHEYWIERIRSFPLPIVLIQDASEYEIEELFSRLNNGEVLSGAEKRNAMGGKMSALIRKVAQDEKFFKEITAFPTKRLQHYEAAAKFLLMEKNAIDSNGEIYCILKKKFLDAMVLDNREIRDADCNKLEKAVGKVLNLMCRVFGKKDPLLKRLSTPQLYYASCRETCANYGHKILYQKLRQFYANFQVERTKNLEIMEEDERNPTLLDFDRLMSQNNDKISMRRRVEILTQYFLKWNPSVSRKGKRNFAPEERLAILTLGGDKCANCGKKISLDEMDADHKKAFAHGGPTTIENARALCVSCNRGEKVQVQ